MLWIGLTGGIATGKSTVSRLLRDRGFDVVDADQLAREAVRSGTEGFREVVKIFGSEVVSPNGELDRKKIAQIVFADRLKLDLLESAIHPRVRELAAQKRAELEDADRDLAFYDVPLLFEKNMTELFDRVVVVACSRETQLARLMARDGLPKVEAELRLNAQIPIANKVAQAHHVIRNEGSLQDLARAVDECLTAMNHHAQT